jgi:hypothetical protein
MEGLVGEVKLRETTIREEELTDSLNSSQWKPTTVMKILDPDLSLPKALITSVRYERQKKAISLGVIEMSVFA